MRGRIGLSREADVQQEAVDLVRIEQARARKGAGVTLVQMLENLGNHIVPRIFGMLEDILNFGNLNRHHFRKMQKKKKTNSALRSLIKILRKQNMRLLPAVAKEPRPLLGDSNFTLCLAAVRRV